jgi:hypothetical protein
MTDVIAFEPGGYRFIRGIFPHSAGIAAEPSYEIERARFAAPLPLATGFAAVEGYLKALGRPVTALAACELRSPSQFTEQEFEKFNQTYVQVLERWGLYKNDTNPVARTNVCPIYDKPPMPSLYAFSYTVPKRGAVGGGRGSFVISGAVEAPDGKGVYSNQIVGLGDTSIAAMRDKMRSVSDAMASRLTVLGFGWPDVLVTQVYTVRDIGALVGEELAKRGFAAHGLTWHFCCPPVANLEYEMDVRAPLREVVI